MFKPSADLIERILDELSRNFTRVFSLEEITNAVFSPEECLGFSDYNPAEERNRQAEVLDALLFLSDRNLIVLDGATDKSRINADK